MSAGFIDNTSDAAYVLVEIESERHAQDRKWGQQNHPDGTARPGDDDMAKLDRAKCKANGPGEDNWRDILQEEISEAFAESDPVALRAELIQVAAVCTAWIEAIDRRPAPPALPPDVATTAPQGSPGADRHSPPE